MNKIFLVRCSTVIVIFLLAFGLVTRGQAAQNSNLATLEDAYATLAHADHDYKGHRVKAMEQIKQAAQELGGKISGKGRGHEPQAASDAQLRAAQGLIRQANAGIPAKAAKHLNDAIAQIDDALAVR